MIMHKVQSSNIHSVVYDCENHDLEIMFHNGRVYRYADVPEAVHSSFMKFASKGSYFNGNIRDTYSTTRLR